MRVELARDVEHLLTRGNRYVAEAKPGGMVEIRGHFSMMIPADWAHVITVAAIDGTPLIEGQTYDLMVDRRRGGPQNMRGWEVLASREEGSFGPKRTIVRLLHRGGRWGGARRDVEVSAIVSAKRVEVPS